MVFSHISSAIYSLVITSFVNVTGGRTDHVILCKYLLANVEMLKYEE